MHHSSTSGPFMKQKWTLSLRLREERGSEYCRLRARNQQEYLHLRVSKDMVRAHWTPLSSCWRVQGEEKVGQTVIHKEMIFRHEAEGGSTDCWEGGGAWNNISESQEIGAGRILREGKESGVQPSKLTVEEGKKWRAQWFNEDFTILEYHQALSTFLPLFFFS